MSTSINFGRRLALAMVAVRRCRAGRGSWSLEMEIKTEKKMHDVLYS